MPVTTEPSTAPLLQAVCLTHSAPEMQV